MVWSRVVDVTGIRSTRELDYRGGHEAKPRPRTNIGNEISPDFCCVPHEADGAVFPSRSRVLEIFDLLVDRTHRNRGHGRQLVTAAREHAKQGGFSHLRVYSAAKRFDDVVRFYRSCGFAPWYVELTDRIG